MGNCHSGGTSGAVRHFPGMDKLRDTVLRTPDGRYIVVRGRLWRSSNPALTEGERQRLVELLMDARRRVRSEDPEAKAAARRDVDRAKIGLGERGPVWWADGAPDYDRHLATNTPYAAWYATTDGDGERRR